jgi:hypothetical protein
MSTRAFKKVVLEEGLFEATTPGAFIKVVTADVGTLAEVATITTAEQDVTVADVAVGDIVLRVEKPTHQAGLAIDGGRIDEVGVVKVKFVNPTAAGITPTADEEYKFVILRIN